MSDNRHTPEPAEAKNIAFNPKTRRQLSLCTLFDSLECIIYDIVEKKGNFDPSLIPKYLGKLKEMKESVYHEIPKKEYSPKPECESPEY